MLQLGDDAARGLGVAVERSRLALVIVAVALAALATAAAGPVVFVAFVAAPIARRLDAVPARRRHGGARRCAADAAVGPRRPPPVRPDRAARRRRHRHRRRPVPAVAAGPLQPRRPRRMTVSDDRHASRAVDDLPVDHVPHVAADSPPSTTLAGQDLCLAYDEREVIARAVGRDPAGQDHRHRRTQRLRQVDAAAGAGPAAQAEGRGPSCSTARRSTGCRPRVVATKLGILPQSPVAPEGITVADLVGRGRYPHQGWFRQWTAADRCRRRRRRWRRPGTLDIADRPVDELSGGQRQRVWIAMTLAQGTGLMLLDEPTTYLDLAHQVDDPRPARRPQPARGAHDRARPARPQPGLPLRPPPDRHARRARSSPRDAPTTIVTPELVTDVFGLPCMVIADPVSGTPMIVPIGRHLHVSTEHER